MPKLWSILLGAGAFLGALMLWCFLTYGGIVKPLFLPTPTAVVADLVQLFTAEDFAYDILMSVFRVLAGFGLAALLATPLGILMGTFRPLEAIVSPFCAFVRYMPAAAFIPLIILWLGIGHGQKISVIFLGVFFYMLILIAGEADQVKKDLIETAYTLGASRWQILRRVIAPAALPGVLKSLRAMVGAAWTYLIVAELVAAQTGIGFRISEAQRFLRTDRVIAGIVVIGAIGVLTDLLFKVVSAWLTSWEE
ncbi:MAG: ABC transporter permease [Acidobacteriota bacterium]